MLTCKICGNETEYNFGKSSKKVICKNCIKPEIKKGNSTGKVISFFGYLFLGLTLLASLLTAAQMKFEEAVYILSGGILLSLFLFGIVEIINQLTEINQNIKNE